MMNLCDSFSNNVLKLLECLSGDDKVIGSPWADNKGDGFVKYLNIIEEINNNKDKKNGNKPKWYK